MKKLALLATMMVLFVCGVNAQTVVNNTEAGKLKKQISKKDYTSITDLKITGMINDKDIMLLEQLPNLESLDISEIVFGTGAVLTAFPNLPKLQSLAIGKHAFTPEAIENISKSPLLHTLYFNMNDGGLYYSSGMKKALYQIRVPSLKKMIYEDIYLDFHHNVEGAIAIDTLILISMHSPIIPSKYSMIGNYLPHYIVTPDGSVFNNLFDPDRTDFHDDPYLTSMLGFDDCYYTHLPSTLDLSGVKGVHCYHFRKNNDIKKIIFSGDIEYINGDAFYSFEGLEEIEIGDGEGNVIIRRDAFSSCKNLKSITIGKPATIEKEAFETANIIKFNAVPISVDKECVEKGYPLIKIPDGTKDQFLALGFNTSKIIEGEASLEFNIKVEKGGSILSYLPLNDLMKIKSLTVSGILYESDLEIIGKCKNLEYLDLGKTMTTYSPEMMKQVRAEQNFFSGLFSLMSDMADMKYDNYEMTSTDYVQSKILLEMLKPSSEVENGDPGCVIPAKCITDMPQLTTLILPYRAVEINRGNFNNCMNLKNIQWPLYLEAIRWETFVNCPNLTELVFPASLSFVGRSSGGDTGAFTDCSGLKLIDLSKSTFYTSEWYHVFDCHAHGLTIKLPNGIEKLTGFDMAYRLPDKNWAADNCNVFLPESVRLLDLSCDGYYLHFTSPTAPVVRGKGNVRHCKIYCPKGSLTSYYTAFGGDEYGNEYFEE